MRDGIYTVLEGGAILDPYVTRFLLKNIIMQPAEESPSSSLLTDRELEILKLISEGNGKKDIAEALNISINTVSYHVKNIYEKLDVSNAPQAVKEGFKKGVL